MTGSSLNQDFILLRKAVEKAAKIAMAHYRKADFKTWTKAGNEPVTEVDIAVNQSLRGDLTAARPDYGWLSEETPDREERLEKALVWVVDPIDGTRAFMRGKADFSITAALIKEGAPVMGVTYAPALGKFYEASRGGGAFVNGQRMAIPGKGNFSGFRLQADPYYIRNTKRWRRPWPAMEISKVQSFALRLAAFAEGKADAVLGARPKSEWDIAAGAVMIEEAGGILCNQDGLPFAFNRANPDVHQVVAVSPEMKEEFLRLVKGRIPKNSP